MVMCNYGVMSKSTGQILGNALVEILLSNIQEDLSNEGLQQLFKMIIKEINNIEINNIQDITQNIEQETSKIFNPAQHYLCLLSHSITKFDD